MTTYLVELMTTHGLQKFTVNTDAGAMHALVEAYRLRTNLEDGFGEPIDLDLSKFVGMELKRAKLRQGECTCKSPTFVVDKVYMSQAEREETKIPKKYAWTLREEPFIVPSTSMDMEPGNRPPCECRYEPGIFPRWAYEHWHCGNCGGIVQWG